MNVISDVTGIAVVPNGSGRPEETMQTRMKRAYFTAALASVVVALLGAAAVA